MIRVHNHHGAPCCGVAPGEQGEVNPANHGVASALAARLLVPVEAPESSALASPLDGPIDPALAKRFDVEWASREASLQRRHADELAVRDARADELRAERDALSAKVAELTTALEVATAPVSETGKKPKKD